MIAIIAQEDIMTPLLDAEKVHLFGKKLKRSKKSAVDRRALWAAFAEAFPGRPSGPEESRWFLAALETLADQGVIQLPAATGKQWESSMGVRVPVSVKIVRQSHEKQPRTWRIFPWHPRLSWVADLKRLSTAQETFLRKVHQGLVEGWFSEPAPMKYRSLQLTGDEKRLGGIAKTTLFGPGKLDLDMLDCMTETLPLAWEAVSDRDRAVVFENADPFMIARRALGEMTDPPYGIVIFGGGNAIRGTIAYLATIGRPVREIHYVGDMDSAGMTIALGALDAARAAGLPEPKPATALHREMLRAARDLGSPNGWPAQRPSAPDAALIARLAAYLSADIHARIAPMLRNENRIPEEVLGIKEMRRGMERVSFDTYADRILYQH